MKHLFCLLLLLPLVGCFERQDVSADRALIRAVQDQKLMAAQDEAAERLLLKQAEASGLAIIFEKRQATGKSLEGLNGPDGRPLLNWSTAEALNTAFDQLESEFRQAIAGLDTLLSVKYKQRGVPIQITEEYLQYVQVRRHTAEYAAESFIKAMADQAPVSLENVKQATNQLAALGLPTSVDGLMAWLQQRSSSLIKGVLSGMK